MIFIGNVWKEGEETRGKLTLLSGAPEGPERVFHFKGFEDLKKILESEFNNSVPVPGEPG